MAANTPDGSQTTTSADEKRKDWQDLREAITHEDNLVNHRLTWLLTIEGFLIGGFFVAQSMVVSKQLTVNEIWGLEILLSIVFLMASWVCLVSSTMILAAYYQIASIRGIWESKYAAEKREKRELLPWFAFRAKTLDERRSAAASTPGQPMTAGLQPEFPSLIGDFDISWHRGSPSIPLIFLIINVIMIVACMTIGIAEFGKNRSGKRQAWVEVTKHGSGTMVKATYHGDMSPAELKREIELLVQP